MPEDIPRGNNLNIHANPESTIDPFVLARMRQHQEGILSIAGQYIGQRNVDIGCGTGIPSLIQQEKLGISSVLCDVVDIREEAAKSLEFHKIEHNHPLPFEDKSFDSSFIEYVLHHVPTRDAAINLLSEAFRIASRVLLVEEIRGEKTDVALAKSVDEQLNALMHSSIPMPVREYFSEDEVRALVRGLGHEIIVHHVIDRGLKENGFLEKHLFVAE